MADLIIRDQQVLAGNYDITGRLRGLSLSLSVDPVDTTKLTADTRENSPGLITVSLSVRGLYDTSFSPDFELYDLVNGLTTVPVTVGASGRVFDSITYSAQLLPTSYERPASVGEAGEFSLEFSSAGLPLRGRLLHALATRTTSGSGTSSQLGAVSSSQRVYLITHVNSVTGGPTVSISAENSATSGGIFTSRVTRSGITAAGAWIDSAAGPLTDTWWRISWTITGGTSPSVRFAAAVAIR